MFVGLLIGIIIASFLVSYANDYKPSLTAVENKTRAYIRIGSSVICIITFCVLIGYLLS